jgi:NhaP-type Na+/H+ or K+/H+ antiporter
MVRILWVVPTAFPSRLLSRYFGPREAPSSWRNVLIVAWTGMRGGVSLAAALALPMTITNGTPFPDRDLVLFLTFGVILATLVGQGLSLGPLIRLLRLPADDAREREHAQAHLTAARAALGRLDELANEEWVTEEALAHLRSVYDEKIQDYTLRIDGVEGRKEQESGRPASKRRLCQEVLQAERVAVIHLRDQRQIDDEVLRLVEQELDWEEQRLQTDR